MYKRLEKNAWLLGMQEAPKLYTYMQMAPHFPSQTCGLAAIGFACLFFFFFKIFVYMLLYAKAKSVAAVKMMPRNPGTRLFLGPEFLESVNLAWNPPGY